MMNWSDLQYFLALADTGSLEKAAERMNVNRTTITRRIAELEQALGSKLFERRGRTLALTPAGCEVRAVAENVEGSLQVLERQVFGRDQKLAGVIRVTATPGLARLLAPEFARFSSDQPDVILDVDVSPVQQDLSMMESDLALRLTNNPPSDLVGRRLARLQSALYASRDTADRLTRNRTVACISLSSDRAVPEPAAQLFPNTRVVASTNSVEVTVEMVAAGRGIAEIPCYVAELDERLVRVSEPVDFRGLSEIWLLYHPQLRNLLRVQAFVEFLVDVFGRYRPAFEGTLQRYHRVA